jgi:hypothetical protein
MENVWRRYCVKRKGCRIAHSGKVGNALRKYCIKLKGYKIK